MPGYTERRATEQLAARLDREAAQQREGIIDRHAEHRKILLTQHLDDYKQHLQNIDASPKHITTTLPRIRKTLVGSKALYWSDLQPSAVSAFLAQLRREWLGIQTSNYYLKAIKGFCQ